MFHLFFSNRSVDQSNVDRLKSRLQNLLPNLPFDDVSSVVPFDEDWKTPARSLLDTCDALICVVGPETHLSEPVEWEIRVAHELKKPLIVTRSSSEFPAPPCCEELKIPIVEWDVSALAGQIAELLVPRALFLRHNWNDGPPNQALIWNQYSLMVSSSESLVARRQTVNALYVSALAALLAGIGLVISSFDKIGHLSASTGTFLLSFLGLALGFNWRRTVISYGTLNRAKFKIISALEDHMPAQLFDAEWRVLEARRYRSTTDTEKQTAFFFSMLFLSIALVSMGVAIGQLLRLEWP